jgi:tripartite-type tricarboxylate transporter receptor subunit TctC
MHKFLFSLLLLLVMTTSHAEPQTVSVVWPFSLAGAQPNMVRQMIDNANKQQNKYQFVFNNVPGAGGTVAANTVNNTKELKVLITSTSFYIRPAMYQASHNPQDFDLLGTVCSKQPFAVFSKKYSRVSDLRDGKASIGIINGTISQLVSTSLQYNNGIVLNDIGYRGTPEAMTDMLSGQLDASVDFFGPMTMARFAEQDKVHVLGITGERNIPGFATFKSQNIKGLESIEFSMYVLVKNATDTATKQELSDIIANSINEPVRKMCVDEYGIIERAAYNSLAGTHQSLIDHWAKFVPTVGIKKQ